MIPLCPKCFSSKLRSLCTAYYKCRECNAEFSSPAFKRPKAKSHSGSGVIAGRITIGKGARWYAGY